MIKSKATMKRTFITLFGFLELCYGFGYDYNNNTFLKCPEFDQIVHGKAYFKDDEPIINAKALHIECDPGYDLVTPSKIYCIDGQWEDHKRPLCVACGQPPTVINGAVNVDGETLENGMYPKGAVAMYRCLDDYELRPSGSKYRVCEKGIWTGEYAKCESTTKITGCAPPKDIANGYFVQEKYGAFDTYAIGQRLHYSCDSGFVLFGSTVQLCLEDGTWSPKIQPSCLPEIADTTDSMCPSLLDIPHTRVGIMKEYTNPEMVGPDSFRHEGAVVQIECETRYRNAIAPCQGPSKVTCVNGKWIGQLPICVEVRECLSPPAVPLGTPFLRNSIPYIGPVLLRYPVESQISYQCLAGYELEGSNVLTCSPDGCWNPPIPPVCRSKSGYFFVPVSDANETNAILISVATGAGVLGLLMIICLTIVCRKKKHMSRAMAIPPPRPRPDLGDHAVLVRQPDRLALIAFAEGLQNGQSALPTYEEATRERPGYSVNRLQRPHWPSLGVRRSRNAPNPEMMGHVTRQGSFASHTTSTRSGGDPMGSTDTMAVSEGSTTVTLDTASSHSGSQAPSCRAHCGSLASFDTSSILNTEGVPLLEENELEEGNTDSISLAMENHSMTDEASYKLPPTADMG